MAKQPSKSHQSAMKTVFAAFQILKANGGEMLGREVIAQIPQKVSLTDWEKEQYEKTGYIRWESILHFYTIAFLAWSQFEDDEYPEKYCHFSGEPSNEETCFKWPVLKENWGKANVEHGL